MKKHMERVKRIAVVIGITVVLFSFSFVSVSAASSSGKSVIINGQQYYQYFEPNVGSEGNDVDEIITKNDIYTVTEVGSMVWDVTASFEKSQWNSVSDLYFKLPSDSGTGVTVFFSIKRTSDMPYPYAELRLEFDVPFSFDAEDNNSAYTFVGTGSTYNQKYPVREVDYILSDTSNDKTVTSTVDLVPVADNPYQLTKVEFTSDQFYDVGDFRMDAVTIRYYFYADIASDAESGTKTCCIWFANGLALDISNSDSALEEYRYNQLLQKFDEFTNGFENKIDELKENQNANTDKITNGWDPNSERPSGSDDIDNYDAAVNELMNSQQDGLDTGMQMVGSIGNEMTEFSSGFMLIIGMFNEFMNVRWLYSLLTISLALGIVAFLLNITSSFASKKTRDDYRREMRNRKGR